MRFRLKLPKAVIFLGLVSLFTDVASEMIYPLLPVFLTSVVGAGPLFVGFLEGFAESTASVMKFFSGYFSDRFRRQTPFVFAGYGVSTVARPLMGVVTGPWQAFFVRFFDRIGKGVRGAPRDAWLATLATAENRGWVFGFHRAMDHAGATIGPLLATVFLLLFPGKYRELFLVTFFPGILALFFILLAARLSKSSRTENPVASSHSEEKLGMREILHFPPSFKRYLIVLMVFTLGNSTDAFLLLRLKDRGLPVAWIPFAWSMFHVVKMSSSAWGGAFSDRFGRKTAITMGWFIYAMVYVLMGFVANLHAVVALFLIYGLYYGLTEGVEKALIADLVGSKQRGSAFGLYHLIIGIGALPASVLFGEITEQFGYVYAFGLGAALAALAGIMLWVWVKVPRKEALSSVAQ